MRERFREVKKVIDTKIRSKKILMKRKYHDGDIIEFNFEPNSIDVYWYEITLIGVISGVIYEKDSISYKVQLRDNKRRIYGDLIVPEGVIKGIIEDSIIIIKCDFCGKLNRVDKNKLNEIKNKEWEKELDKLNEMENKEWEKFYCIGKEHHILNVCPTCVDTKMADIEQEKCKCPYDNYIIISEQKKKCFEDHGIKLVDKI